MVFVFVNEGFSHKATDTVQPVSPLAVWITAQF